LKADIVTVLPIRNQQCIFLEELIKLKKDLMISMNLFLKPNAGQGGLRLTISSLLLELSINQQYSNKFTFTSLAVLMVIKLMMFIKYR
jgi:hypothetical protein